MTTIRKLSVPTETEVRHRTGVEIFNNAKTDIRNRPGFPPVCIGIGEDENEYNGVHYPLRFGTYGNISLIRGQEKTRKSFFKSLLLAGAIGGKANNYCERIRGYGLEDRYVIDIDSEQGDYDRWLNASRIPKMCGSLPDNYINYGLREYNVEEKRSFLEYLFMESAIKDKIGLVMIDGYVDFVKDFNSQEQSFEFTLDLMKYSTISKSHITGILHLNPGSDKGRGHLGTVLQQKCETIVTLIDHGSYSTATCTRARGKKFDDINFKINNDWLPEETESVDPGLGM
jgi:hypothetical protein